MLNFVAIDFETANFEKSSVCSVGICIVKDGEIVDNYYSLIRPVPNSRVQHHDRKGRYRSAKSTGDMGFRSQNDNLAGSRFGFQEKQNQLVQRGDFERRNNGALRLAKRDHLAKSVTTNCGYDLKNHHHALADAEACAVIGIQIL